MRSNLQVFFRKYHYCLGFLSYNEANKEIVRGEWEERIPIRQMRSESKGNNIGNTVLCYFRYVQIYFCNLPSLNRPFLPVDLGDFLLQGPFDTSTISFL